MLKSEELPLAIDNPAHAIWPGHVHARRDGIHVNEETQFTHTLAAHPSLPELPGANVLREKSWTVEVKGIDAKLVELWFTEYRYLGDGHDPPSRARAGAAR